MLLYQPTCAASCANLRACFPRALKTMNGIRPKALFRCLVRGGRIYNPSSDFIGPVASPLSHRYPSADG